MRRQPDGTYVFVDRPILLVLGALVFAFSFAIALWDRVEAHGFDGWSIALAIGIGASITGALAIPGTRFTFDPNRKLISWSTRSALSGDGGQVDFSSVQNVVLQTTENSDGTVMYRVALCTPGNTLPLGVAYTNGQAKAEKLAAELRGILNLPEKNANP